MSWMIAVILNALALIALVVWPGAKLDLALDELGISIVALGALAFLATMAIWLAYFIVT